MIYQNRQKNLVSSYLNGIHPNNFGSTTLNPSNQSAHLNARAGSGKSKLGLTQTLSASTRYNKNPSLPVGAKNKTRNNGVTTNTLIKTNEGISSNTISVENQKLAVNKSLVGRYSNNP